MNILDHFEKIVALAGGNGLNSKFFEAAREHIEAAGALLHTNPTQTALFALILENYGENSVSADDIAKTLKCGKMQFLRYMDEFDALKQKRLIKTASSRYSSGSFQRYTIPADVIKAIRNNTEYQCTKFDDLSPEDFLDCANNILKAAKRDDLDTDGLKEELSYLFEHNAKNSFVKKTKEYDLNEGSIIILIVFSYALLRNDDELIKAEDLMEELREIMGYQEVHHVENRLQSGKHKVMEKGLIQFDCRDGIADTEHFRLTEKAREEFLADINFMEKEKNRGKNFIKAKNLSERKLFYAEKIRNRIDELTDLLSEDNFAGIQKRLAESKMRTGFACIFSGPPGTGKTETAYQIARKTGRDIMLVNIAETKSMWFGESEKRIKHVFDRYRSAVKNGGLAPILLFNEADAVLGKRRELSQSRNGPDQTENAIQNIILQEIENLNGILIATTNMSVNLDKAFERRFLYKIEFEKPNVASKTQMWQSFIPSLEENDAARLAEKYDFSGGQIENIARKNTVTYILKGTNSNLSILENFCKEELMEKAAVRIGFCSE
jgi:hypothetical protein